ncbi:hydantoinase/oxoprolinase family protein [Mesorhizobium sp. M0910]|uniref:hydantoinase/oxoprolinase family protein n=1 Tax=Mesorhizobium sp. M0910 TaxID=2957025 RepID=UPI00333B5EC2
MEIGVDTGGTHTDIVLLDRARGLFETLKVPTTPLDLSEGILTGVDAICRQAGVPQSGVARFVYGTTLVTNLIVEQKTGSVGLLTTMGFRDVLEIGRAVRKPNIYDIQWRPKSPLIARRNRIGINERVSARGDILVPINGDEIVAALTLLVEQGVTSVAVCFLHSYSNPANEQAVRRIAEAQFPALTISLSSEVVRQFREFERSSTIAINAYVSEPLGKHLDRLFSVLKSNEIAGAPYIMGGNGGVVSFERAKQIPVSITHSGPVAGILGGATLAKAAGFPNVITFDMGGTSSDVSLVVNSEPSLTSRGSLAGYPVQLPTIDLVTIGSGGGSKALVDSGGGLHVGPESAGSVPGPMCYGQGGEWPTITDANLTTGRLNKEYFLAGKRALYPDLAESGITAKVAEPLSMSFAEAALGILDIAEADMVNAIKLVSVQRGLDPRDFTLVGFGGAGPLHVISLADALGMKSVLVPPAPGNVSAAGLLCAEWRQDLVRTFIRDLDGVTSSELTKVFEGLEAEAADLLAEEDLDPTAHRALLSLDLQYTGQGFELNIPVSKSEFEGDWKNSLMKRFSDLHKERYGYALSDRGVQIVNLRLTVLGIRPDLPWPERRHRTSGELTIFGRRKVLHRRTDFEKPWPVYRFLNVRAGDTLNGPAIVEYPGSTLVVPPDWKVTYDKWGNAIAIQD